MVNNSFLCILDSHCIDAFWDNQMKYIKLLLTSCEKNLGRLLKFGHSYIFCDPITLFVLQATIAVVEDWERGYPDPTLSRSRGKTVWWHPDCFSARNFSPPITLQKTQSTVLLLSMCEKMATCAEETYVVPRIGVSISKSEFRMIFLSIIQNMGYDRPTDDQREAVDVREGCLRVTSNG